MQEPCISVNIPPRDRGHLVRDGRGLFVPADAERARLELLRLPPVAAGETGETEGAS